MRCPGSVVLEAQYPDTGSAYAAEGSVAHDIATGVLTEPDYVVPVGEVVEYEGHKILVSREMQGYVEEYTDFVRQLAEGGSLMVENDVSIGHLTGEEGATGRGDVIVVKPRHFDLADLKYGAGVKVYASDILEDGETRVINPQMGMYALGGTHDLEYLDTFDSVTVHIYQPRMDHHDEFTVTAAELVEFGKTVTAAAARAHKAIELIELGETETDLEAKGYFSPGPKQCKFCSAKGNCQALRHEVMLNVGGTVTVPATAAEFAQFVPIEVGAETGDNYLSIAMEKADLVELWYKAVRAEVERRLLAGQPVTGYKIVEGKLGNRSWTDPAKVEEIFKKSFRLKDADAYDQKLISPTTAEKLLKGSPGKWERVSAFITRKPGSPSVAPATDKRPALEIGNTADDLRALSTSE
jgi:hypothetical protein